MTDGDVKERDFLMKNEILAEVGPNPVFQFESNGRNLDNISDGNHSDQYGLALRLNIFGKDGPSDVMVRPKRSGTRPASRKQLLLTFQSKFC